MISSNGLLCTLGPGLWPFRFPHRGPPGTWFHTDTWLSASFCFSAQFPPKRRFLQILSPCLCMSSTAFCSLSPASTQPGRKWRPRTHSGPNPVTTTSAIIHGVFSAHKASPAPASHPATWLPAGVSHHTHPPSPQALLPPLKKNSIPGLAPLILMALGRLGRIFLPAGTETPQQSLELHNQKMWVPAAEDTAHRGCSSTHEFPEHPAVLSCSAAPHTPLVPGMAEDEPCHQQPSPKPHQGTTPPPLHLPFRGLLTPTTSAQHHQLFGRSGVNGNSAVQVGLGGPHFEGHGKVPQHFVAAQPLCVHFHRI